MLEPAVNIGNHFIRGNLTASSPSHVLDSLLRNRQPFEPLLRNCMIDGTQIALQVHIGELSYRFLDGHSYYDSALRETKQRLFSLYGAASSKSGANRAPANNNIPDKISVTSVNPSPTRRLETPEIAPIICGENVSPSI